MSLVPTVNVRFAFADVGLEQPARALLIAPIAADGNGTANTPAKISSVADASDHFGMSDGLEAARRWFRLGLQSELELWAFGIDATGFTANTWAVTATGTAARAGINVVRLGDAVVNVALAKDDTAANAATKMAAAITASLAPFSAAVNGVIAEQVDITSDYVGTHIARTPVSVDLFRDRGETGVEGMSWAVVNNADATGAPTILNATNLAQQAYLWYLNAFQGTAWLDSLETWLENRWEIANNYAHALTSISGSQTDAIALGSVRNDKHIAYIAASDAWEYELQTAISTLRAILDESAERGPGIGGIGTVLPMNALTQNLDAQALLEAGVTPLRVVATTVATVRLVNNRRTNEEGAQDQRFFDLGAVLRVRELGDRLVALLAPKLGDAIVQDGVALSPNVARNSTSVARLTSEVSALLVDAVKDGILDATEETAANALQSISVLETGGIKTGFALLFDPRIVQNVTQIDALVSLR